ncbi:MAG: hypothetical protein IT563_14940 [Alphaproteobacteria bacterium]|nr:hypothetical protein [Alphaproteobacteria bacterium]
MATTRIGAAMRARKPGIVAGSALGLLFCAWALLYLTGLFPYLGYKSNTERFDSMFDNPSHLGWTAVTGLDAWPETFLLFTGQEVFIDYRVDIRRGSLWLFVRPWASWDFATQERVTESGHGRLVHRVASTGLYHIVAQPSNARGPGRGYDLTYTATWGATWGANRAAGR